MSEIFIIIGLIILNGIFAMSEIALISARKSKLGSDSKKGNRSAETALKLAEQPDRFLSTIQIGITLIGILTGIYSGNQIAQIVKDLFVSVGISPVYAPAAAQIIIVILVTYLTLIFGELLPKRIGLCMAESVAKFVARPMYMLSRVASPFVWLLSGSTAFLFRILGLKDKESKVTEEEIKSIVKEGTEDGEVQPVEHDIVQRVFLLGDLEVDAIMTPRNDMVWLNNTMTAKEVKEIIAKDMFAVYPVADGDLDHVKGIVSLKNLFFVLDKTDFCLDNIVEEPTFIYENMDVYKALELMKSQHTGFSLVCDEFGSCVGIVTLKDILEGLVGNMPGEHDGEQQIVPRSNGDGWLVDGQCPMFDFLKYFNEEELYENEDYNTVAGLCINTLEHIPVCGEHFEWKIFSFEIIDMDGARIDKFLVKKK